jgi:hypothetical protein
LVCDESDPCKKLTFTKPEGVRKTSSEMDGYHGTSSAYSGAQRLKIIALDRSIWQGIVKVVKA